MKYKKGDKIKTTTKLINGNCFLENKEGEIISSYVDQDKKDIYVVKLNGTSREYYCTEDMITLIKEKEDNILQNKKFKKEDFKFKDIVTVRYFAEEKFIFINGCIYMEDGASLSLDGYNEELKYRCDYNCYDIMKVERIKEIPSNYNGKSMLVLETVYERKDVLTEEEKKYLKNIINGINTYVNVIEKNKNNKLCIKVKDAKGYHTILELDINTLICKFEGIEANKNYSLNQLELL